MSWTKCVDLIFPNHCKEADMANKALIHPEDHAHQTFSADSCLNLAGMTCRFKKKKKKQLG